MKHRTSKLILFNLVLSIVCIVLFSPGLLGFSPTADESLKRILFFVAIIVAFALFIVVNYILLSQEKAVKIVDNDDLKNPKDYVKALQDYAYKKEFEPQIAALLGQLKRVPPKKAGLDVILEQNFDKSEMTYIKFSSTINEVINLFYDNTKKAIKRIGVFDEEEYRKLKRNQLNLPEDSHELKLKIYNEHISFINSMISQNESIITLLDNLILEISKLDEINGQNMENIQIISEMRELIKNTKYYGQ